MNRLQKLVQQIGKLPASWQPTALSYTLGQVVKFTGTAGLRFEKMTQEEVVVKVANKKKVQNHIGQVHAVASALLAESATGMVVGMNLPDDKLPLLKRMEIDYTKRSQGAQTAIARLSPADRQRLIDEPKGDVLVPVTINDETGTEVVQMKFYWAWIPKKKKEASG